MGCLRRTRQRGRAGAPLQRLASSRTDGNLAPPQVMRVARANVIGLATFTAAYPQYSTTRALDDRRAREYPLLDSLGHVYLDYTAGNLVPLSLVDRHMALLRDHLLGNPHSTNPASALATTFVEQARLSVLDFFNADPDEYVVIFTANATQALKLVGEAYPFDAGGEYLLTFDNHNSVNGIREFARAKGCPTTYVPIVLPDMRVDEAELASHLERRQPGRPSPVCLSGTIELFRRAASARLDSACAGARMGRAARCGGVYADQSPRPWPLAARLRVAELLQDVRLSDRSRLPHRTQGGAREAAAAVVCGRHDHGRIGAGRQVLSRRRRVGVRGRHAELSRAACRRVRPPVSLADRDRHDSHARPLPHRMADRSAERAPPLEWRSRWRASTGPGRTFDAAAPSRSISTTPPAARSITATSRSARTPPEFHCGRVASAIQAEARLRSASRAPSCRRASISPSTKPI